MERLEGIEPSYTRLEDESLIRSATGAWSLRDESNSHRSVISRLLYR
jgi:hypothetical protein